MYNHNKSIAERVMGLLNLTDEEFSEYPEVHRLASAEMIGKIGSSNYAVYASLFSELTQAQYDAIVEKELWMQNTRERLLVMSESAEAYLYAYFLIPKMKKISQNNLSFDNINQSGSGISPIGERDIKRKQNSFYDDAMSLLEKLDFNIDGEGILTGSNVMVISAPNRKVVYRDQEGK